MKRPAPILLVDLGTLALALFWWGGDAIRAVRAQHAWVSALAQPPELGFAILSLVLVLAAAGWAAVGLVQRQGRDFKGYRALPICAVVLLFVDVLVLPSSALPLRSADQLALNLQLFGELASEQMHDGMAPSDPAVLQALASKLGPPPYLVHGEPLHHFQIQIREGCDGPLKSAPGVEVGTLLYCLAKDGKTAWVSAVALPAEVQFGDPAVFSREGVVQWVQISPRGPLP
jgi:hypothetical protein